MIVALIGYRATGKSTVGQLLAHRLGWACVDTDVEVQNSAGKSVREIFEQDGEAQFRHYESQVVHHLTRRHKLVLSLGGGAVLAEENRRALSLAGPVVWLQASPQHIRQRLQGDTRTESLRPSLTSTSAIDEIEQVLQERTPVYEACADVVIDTDGATPSEIVDQIINALGLTPENGLS